MFAPTTNRGTICTAVPEIRRRPGISHTYIMLVFPASLQCEHFDVFYCSLTFAQSAVRSLILGLSLAQYHYCRYPTQLAKMSFEKMLVHSSCRFF